MPIDTIIKAESDAMDLPQSRGKEIREKYERYVMGLMNAVSVWLGMGNASLADKMELGRMARSDGEPEWVRMAKERELFEYLNSVFHKDFKASYKANMLLTTSIDNNKFNCYASTVLLADVLLRLGKPVTFVTTLDHVLLRGEAFMLETTTASGPSTYPRSAFIQGNGAWHEGGIDIVLSIADSWCGAILEQRKKYPQALSYYDEAIRLDPIDSTPWTGKGNALYGQKRLAEALLAFDRSIELNPESALAWCNRGLVFNELGNKRTLFSKGLDRLGQALADFERAIELNPKMFEAWNGKGLTLQKMGCKAEGQRCIDKSWELQAAEQD